MSNDPMVAALRNVTPAEARALLHLYEEMIGHGSA